MVRSAVWRDGLELVELASDHLGDELRVRQLSGPVLTDQLTVAQYRDPVGDLIDLVQEVADEEDRHSPVAQIADHREQPVHLVPVQAGRGLVQDEHARLTDHGPADRDQLLDRDRLAGEDRVRVEVQPEVLQVASRLPVRRPPVDAASRSGFVAQHHVLADREVGTEVHLLVDGRDACGLGVCRAAEDPGLAGDLDRAVVDGVLPGQRLDQGRLAGAVLTHQRVDLARPEDEVHLVEGQDSGESGS